MGMDGATPPVAPVWELLEAVVVEVPFSCSAKAWKAVKLRGEDSSEFTENTIPAPQWLDGAV
jgi:hypothetical protein